MSKRRQPAPQALQQERQASDEEQYMNGEHLDVSSDEDLADDEAEGEGSGSDESGESDGEEEGSDDEEIRTAIAEYLQAASAPRPDGSADMRPAEASNRDAEGAWLFRSLDLFRVIAVGDVPLKWYKDEEHIGYDIEGTRITKAKRADKLDTLLARNDSKKALRTIYDEYNDEEIVLSKEELAMIMRIRKGQFPHVEVNPYEPYLDYFSGDVDPTPLINAPEPKRRFIPGMTLKVVVGRGLNRPGDMSAVAADKSGAGLTYIPPAKPKLPGHDESYNPPKEYVPTEEEKAGWELMPPEERPQYVPQGFDCLRHVPLYDKFIKERFERCLDLYLCPRVRKKRMFIDPKTLVPKLPKPQDLQPFPQVLAVRYSGHTGDYFASVAPTGGTQSVLVHQLSKRASQNPFRKNRGRVMRVAFHPSKPFFFVATQNTIRIYNLAKQVLAKKLVGGSGVISCLAVHPSGDHVIVGSEDKRLAWYDLDLSTTAYKALRYHTYAVRGCAFHSTYPLFASSSDDGSTHVFHGRVYSDLMTNPLIVPVKILRGHKVVNSAGVLDCAFHPTQPWLFTAGADGDALLFSN
eukprot:gene9044-9215_t